MFPIQWIRSGRIVPKAGRLRRPLLIPSDGARFCLAEADFSRTVFYLFSELALASLRSYALNPADSVALNYGASPMAKPKSSKKRTERRLLDLDRHVPYFFTNISSRLSRGASQTYLKYFGVGITEWRVIAVLALMPNISANQICAAVGLDKAAVSRSLQTLERRGLVAMTDDPLDNRSRSLALTAAGDDLHDRIIEVALEREMRLLSCLTPDEVEGLVLALRKIRAQVPLANAYDPELAPFEPQADAAPRVERRKRG